MKRFWSLVVFIYAPKNSGLEKYRDISLRYINWKNSKESKIITVRGEDVPFWVDRTIRAGKPAIGLTGYDLFEEYNLRTPNNLRILKTIEWVDDTALYKKPCLCLLALDSRLLFKKREISVAAPSKYRCIVQKYLSGMPWKCTVTYLSGCVEMTSVQGLSDLVIDIVYSGSSIRRYNLQVIDRICSSDFVIIGNRRSR
jgi:ATP phosphoribosyltransferase